MKQSPGSNPFTPGLSFRPGLKISGLLVYQPNILAQINYVDSAFSWKSFRNQAKRFLFLVAGGMWCSTLTQQLLWPKTFAVSLTFLLCGTKLFVGVQSCPRSGLEFSGYVLVWRLVIKVVNKRMNFQGLQPELAAVAEQVNVEQASGLASDSSSCSSSSSSSDSSASSSESSDNEDSGQESLHKHKKR